MEQFKGITMKVREKSRFTFKTFEMDPPTTGDWIEAMKPTSIEEQITPAGLTMGAQKMTSSDLTILVKLVMRCGYFDGEKKERGDVESLPYGFFEKVFLMLRSEDLSFTLAQDPESAAETEQQKSADTLTGSQEMIPPRDTVTTPAGSTE